jgi:hypothetical protein
MLGVCGEAMSCNRGRVKSPTHICHLSVGVWVVDERECKPPARDVATGTSHQLSYSSILLLHACERLAAHDGCERGAWVRAGGGRTIVEEQSGDVRNGPLLPAGPDQLGPQLEQVCFAFGKGTNTNTGNLHQSPLHSWTAFRALSVLCRWSYLSITSYQSPKVV